jgi:hypothetical protein
MLQKLNHLHGQCMTTTRDIHVEVMAWLWEETLRTKKDLEMLLSLRPTPPPSD